MTTHTTPSLLALHGLFAGLPCVDDSFYTNDMHNLDAASKLLSTPGFLWAAAVSDAAALGIPVDEYVARVELNAAAFINSDKLFGRVETMGALHKLMGQSKGTIALVLGDKSIGKTFMVNKLIVELQAQDPNRVVAHLNARVTGSDLTKGIISAINGASDTKFINKFWVFLTSALNTAASIPPPSSPVVQVIGIAAESSLPGSGIFTKALVASSSIVSKSLSSFLAAPPITVIQSFVEACAAANPTKFPVLIIDEVNLALPSASSAQAASTLALLHFLLSLTKAHGLMNVLFVASEYTEPFRLNALGFSTEHFTDTIITSELSPFEMHQLLANVWGCSPALTQGLIAVYGGNILRARNALLKLSLEKDRYAAVRALSSGAQDAVFACLSAVRSVDPSMTGLEDMMRSLAIHGFAGIPGRTDPRAELLTKHNVACVVSKSAFAPGVPPAAWTHGGADVLVPAGQSMRLVLAWHLVKLKEAKSKAKKKAAWWSFWS